MRKRYFASAAGTIGLGAVVGYFLSNKENRTKLQDKIARMTSKEGNGKSHSTLEDAGIPDQVDHADLAQLENSKMVSEGSQYGVQYYNEVIHGEEEDRIQ